MSDNIKKKRMIARHVDGSLKVGLIPIRKVPKVLVAFGLIIYVALKFFAPVTLFISIVLLGLVAFIYSEFNGETGIEVIKLIIKYELEGDIHFERSCLLEDESKRFIFKKIRKNQS